MDRNQADALVRSLGGLLGIADLTLDDSGSGTLFIDDGAVIVTFGHNAMAQAIDLMVCLDAVELATVPLDLVLRANFAWLGSRGATFAIEPVSGALVLQRRVVEADAAVLHSALGELVDAADAWTRRLASGDAATAQAESAVMGIRA